MAVTAACGLKFSKRLPRLRPLYRIRWAGRRVLQDTAHARLSLTPLQTCEAACAHPAQMIKESAVCVTESGTLAGLTAGLVSAWRIGSSPVRQATSTM